MDIDYAVIVTAYQNLDQVPDAIASVLETGYASLHIYVVADNCEKRAFTFSEEKVSVLWPETVLKSNTGSHRYACEHFVRPHDVVLILDSDNIVDSQIFVELNKGFSKGFNAVQGLRSAKNLDTDLARLDAARDVYYHFYDGLVLFEAGSSATLAGSGMAFNANMYKDWLSKRQVEGAGFDKVLQAYWVKNGERIAWAGEAVVFDEKTKGSDQLVNQRARWINTWFKYFALGFGIFFKGLFTLDANRLLFGLILLRPPLFILLILSGLFALVNLIFAPLLFVYWCVAFALFFLSFAVALNQPEVDPGIKKALLKAPKFIYFQVLALLKSRRANKISVATKHGGDEGISEK
ncbi:glycosyltransferase [Marinilongibacter aquaticus]|uniref:glycosyltransferase n=1 Tax=Marinilongibacter aquaticus TaxID=2975157 RepID=UPI0021BD0C72|nr:glycosyltransferase [Marinilongibacter aquaticus]UBM60733.1 glycosyltransferase [Marinilongibacter aquaticus]